MHHPFRLIILALLISVLAGASSISLGQAVEQPRLWADPASLTLLDVGKIGRQTVYHCSVVVKNPTPKAMNFGLRLSVPRARVLGFKLNETMDARLTPAKSGSAYFIWPYQIGIFDAYFIQSAPRQKKTTLMDNRLPGTVAVADPKEARLKPIDGIYIGMEPIASRLPNTLWLHENRLIIKDNNASLVVKPYFIEHGKLYSSAIASECHAYHGRLIAKNRRVYLQCSDGRRTDTVQNPLTGPIVLKEGRLLLHGVVYRPRASVIADLVQSAAYQNYDRTFYDIGDEPLLAAALLIKELHPVNETHILPSEFQSQQEAMHVIRCLRALRYITGRDFTAPSRYSFGQSEPERARKYWVTKGGKSQALTFFGTWMSRDSIYIAPTDAQERIIAKWQKWYRDVGRFGKYQGNDNEHFWYF